MSGFQIWIHINIFKARKLNFNTFKVRSFESEIVIACNFEQVAGAIQIFMVFFMGALFRLKMTRH